MNSAAPRILVIRRRYLGDIVLLGSLFRNLKLHWPGARLTALIEPAYAGVLALNPDVDEVLPFPQRVGDWPKIALQLRRGRFTHVLDLDNREKTAVLTRLTGAAVRATVRHGERLVLAGCYTATEIVPRAFLDERHITDLYLYVLNLIGVPIVTHECRLQPRPGDLAFARTLIAAANFPPAARRVLVHPGTRSAWRIWPPENFAAVIDELQDRHDAAVAVIAGPGEQGTVDAICERLKRPVFRVQQTLAVPQLAALFASFDVMLCHDSGPMHLATAVGTRVVALYGSQPLNIWRPLGERAVTLRPPLPCVNCVSPGQCNPADSYVNHCVRNITTGRVLAAAEQSLRS